MSCFTCITECFIEPTKDKKYHTYSCTTQTYRHTVDKIPNLIGHLKTPLEIKESIPPIKYI